jgi:hypothetical protein
MTKACAAVAGKAVCLGQQLLRSQQQPLWVHSLTRTSMHPKVISTSGNMAVNANNLVVSTWLLIPCDQQHVVATTAAMCAMAKHVTCGWQQNELHQIKHMNFGCATRANATPACPFCTHQADMRASGRNGGQQNT